MWEDIIGKCDMCKVPILKDEAYYKLGKYLFEGVVCEECMADFHKCKQCGLNQPYCNDCI